ncbi:hypothetical protein BN439_1392 [Erwinia amylovora Ea644]|nr:hypothetical protein BN439_1392 [Erwinia amylovora Ea644]CCP06478.1 hypothetical protein BN440_1436 [Erwinia amylovora MR1]
MLADKVLPLISDDPRRAAQWRYALVYAFID